MVLLHNLKNVFFVQELRKKLLFTLGVFTVFRIGTYIPVPGIDMMSLRTLFSAGFKGGFLGYLDLFSGGALGNFAIFSLAMSPYITASIMMQLLALMIPSLESLSKEGEHGRRQLNQYTRYLTIILAISQAWGAAMVIERYPGVVLSPGWGFRLTTVLILTIGALFVMWLGEQITAHGIGNGSSMIIFAGIVARLPSVLFRVAENVMLGQIDLLMVAIAAVVTIVIVSCIIFLEKGERRIPVQYARRVVGHRMFGGQVSYIPLKLNPVNVVPVIFAQAPLSMIMTVSGLLAARWPDVNRFMTEWFAFDGLLYLTLQAALIIFFAFFYTAIMFDPNELAENLRKSGGFIVGMRPGRKTAEYFEYLLTRVGFPGAVYLATLAIAPQIIKNMVNVPWLFSGVSLLIVIGVALDVSAQMESYLIERRYEGFLSSGRLKGRSAAR